MYNKTDIHPGSRQTADSPAMRTLRRVLSIVVPRTCCVCGAGLSDSEEYLCGHCYIAMPRTGVHRMPTCRVSDIMARAWPRVRIASWFHYTRGTEFCQIIYDNKYRHLPRIGRLAGADFARELQADNFFDGIDLLMPIPVHWRKRLARGYNQAEMVARGVSAVTGLPVSTDLRVGRSHISQTHFGREQRMANISAENFRIRNPQSLAGKHILLVDDVITTGATMAAAVSALAKACPDLGDISVLTLAMTEQI